MITAKKIEAAALVIFTATVGPAEEYLKARGQKQRQDFDRLIRDALEAAEAATESTPNPAPVVDLDQARMQRGETMFVVCPCEAEQTDPDAPSPAWFVTAVLAGGRPVISTLVCTECHRVADVTNGFMSTPEKREAPHG